MSKKWNSDIMFPTDSDYIARIVGATFAPSSKGNPMLTLSFEVVSPQEKEVAGEMVVMAGIKAKKYYVTSALDESGEVDVEKSERCVETIKKLAESLGIGELDLSNINTQPWLGKLCYAQMSSNITEQRKTPTASQIEAAKKAGKRPEGDVMKHPVTGKALIEYWPQIDQIFGLAPSDGVNMAY